MATWPVADPAWKNDELLFDIDVVQKVVGLGREARSESGVRTRQPLSRLLVRAPNDQAARALVAHQDQVLEELNIKNVEFIARDADIVNYRIKPNLPKLGKEGHGKNLPAIRKALEEADGKLIAGAVARGESYTLAFPGGEVTLTGEDMLIETSSAEGYACAEDVGYLAALDTSLSDELIAEGMAREIVRSVQDARKQAGLEVADRINLGVSGSAAIEKALATHRDYVMAETLAIEWSVGQTDPLFASEKDLGDEHWSIEISKS
jgi:isoleucyl-tRNA synthetase